MGVPFLALSFASCTPKSYDKMTPEEQAKEYAKFQEDSVKMCTQNEYFAKQLVLSAFNRVTNYSDKYKKTKVDVYYDENIHGWVGSIDYRVSKGNVMSEGNKTFHIFIWTEFNGLAKDRKIYCREVQVIKDASVPEFPLNN